MNINESPWTDFDLEYEQQHVVIEYNNAFHSGFYWIVENKNIKNPEEISQSESESVDIT